MSRSRKCGPWIIFYIVIDVIDKDFHHISRFSIYKNDAHTRIIICCVVRQVKQHWKLIFVHFLIRGKKNIDSTHSIDNNQC